VLQGKAIREHKSRFKTGLPLSSYWIRQPQNSHSFAVLPFDVKREVGLSQHLLSQAQNAADYCMLFKALSAMSAEVR
jgi:hypothetical protein